VLVQQGADHATDGARAIDDESHALSRPAGQDEDEYSACRFAVTAGVIWSIDGPGLGLHLIKQRSYLRVKRHGMVTPRELGRSQDAT
jgi:hypothetical protein